MQDLIDAVVRKTGLPADKAKAAVEAVLDQLKAKLPGPLAGDAIDSLHTDMAFIAADGITLSGGSVPSRSTTQPWRGR
jgi:DeoR/GlpR family transcriptional regulator of sugar metabolism